MIKLKQLLKEEYYQSRENLPPYNEIEANIILDNLKNYMQFETLIYRGISRIENTGYGVQHPRHDRKLKDTPEIINATIEGYIDFIGKDIIPDRRSAVFASTSQKTASGFGNYVVVIFPNKYATILYNKDYRDSYDLTDVGGISALSNIVDSQGGNIIEEILVEINATQLAYLLFDVYSHLSAQSKDDIYIKMKNINYDMLIKEIKLLIHELQLKELEPVITYLNTYGDELTWPLHRQLKFFERLIVYVGEMQVIRDGDNFSVGEGIDNELIIDCTQYFYVDSYKFNKTFKWHPQSHSYIIYNVSIPKQYD